MNPTPLAAHESSINIGFFSATYNGFIHSLIIFVFRFFILSLLLDFSLYRVTGFLFLDAHAYEVTLHCLFETLFVFFWVDYGRSLTTIDDVLELTLKDLV